MAFTEGNQLGNRKGREPGSKNKRTLARIATIKRAVEQGVELSTGDKLTAEDIALAVKLMDDGETQASVASKLGVSQATISRALSQFEDTTSLAKKRLKASALRLTDMALAATQLAAEIGNAEPALELLDRLEVAARRDSGATGGGPRVVVMVGAATQAALPPALLAIDVDSRSVEKQ